MLTGQPFRRNNPRFKSYCKVMSEPNDRHLYDDFVAEILKQQGFEIEESPRSIYDPQQLYTALERYATNWTKFEEFDEHLTFGFKKAFAIYAKPKDDKKIDILPDHLIPGEALKLGKSSGLPALTTKKEDLVYAFDREAQIRNNTKAANPCIAYKRTQKNNKTRLVWGYPLEMTIMESRFARPLISVFSKKRTPMAFAMKKHVLGSYIDKYIVDEPGTIVGLDYSKFDSTISASMIKQSFRILKTWFKDEDIEEYGWNKMVGYFIKTPIVMPDGMLYKQKNHGVPSGSYFTQMIDSIVNTALVFALSHKFSLSVSPLDFFVLGDDVLLRCKTKVQLSKWADYLKSIGIIMNPDKTEIGYAHFLGADWIKGKPDADILELAAKAAQPESWRDYDGDTYEGSLAVLYSYASSYKSAVHLVPRDNLVPWDLRRLDMRNVLSSSKYSSGSDRFLQEERELREGNRNQGNYYPTLSYRYLV